MCEYIENEKAYISRYKENASSCKRKDRCSQEVGLCPCCNPQSQEPVESSLWVEKDMPGKDLLKLEWVAGSYFLRFTNLLYLYDRLEL